MKGFKRNQSIDGQNKIRRISSINKQSVHLQGNGIVTDGIQLVQLSSSIISNNGLQNIELLPNKIYPDDTQNNKVKASSYAVLPNKLNQDPSSNMDIRDFKLEK